MSRVRRSLAALTVAGALAAAAGCGGGSGTSNQPPPAPPAAPATDQTTAVPTTAPAVEPTSAAPVVPASLRFTATTVDGARFDAATLAGRPVVFWFWATWCPKCKAAAPTVAAVQREFGGRVVFVGVAGLGSGGNGAMRDFIAARGIGGFVNLSDDAGAVWRHFQVTTQERYVVLDASGTVVHRGPLSGQDLRSRVATLAA